MKSIEVKINDWEKFNPRSDRANYSWFRFENKFFLKTFSWTGEEQRLFIYLCSSASQENKDVFLFDLDLASALLKRKKKQILEDLKVLKERGVIEPSLSRHDDGEEPALLPATNVTYETNETNDIVSFDFEAIYKSYPRKEGKTKGLEKCESLIKTVEDYALLVRSVNNYSKKMRIERTEKKFIKMFSSFMSVWRDYVEVDLEPQKNIHRLPSGIPEELNKPHTNSGPLEGNVKHALDIALGRIPKTPGGAA